MTALDPQLVANIDFAVLGLPIAHSLSPRIHAAFAADTGIALSYQAIAVAPSELPEFLCQAHQNKARGFNITLPHKQAVLPLCTELSPRAKAAGAVNTLIRAPLGWLGDNTDGAGFVRDITLRHHYALQDKRVLIVGAGGAASGVLPALLEAGAAHIHITNRNADKAHALAARWESTRKVLGIAFAELGQCSAFDLVINASAAGHSQSEFELPESLLSSAGFAYDLSYGNAAVAFLRWACEIECTAVDGLGMLIEQAAEAFYQWHGVRVDTTRIWGELRA
jgi:shikimate dehydrogenase